MNRSRGNAPVLRSENVLYGYGAHPIGEWWLLANRATAENWSRSHYVKPRLAQGMNLGGGSSLGLAQSLCPWWIEGMLRLLLAIERAPDE